MKNSYDKKSYFIGLIIIVSSIIISVTIGLVDNYVGIERILRCITGYSFWANLFGERNGQILMFCSPIIIIIACVYPFHQKLHTGIKIASLTRQRYHKFILSGIKSAYLKAILLFPPIYILTFFICKYTFQTYNNEIDVSSAFCSFSPDMLVNDMAYLAMTVIGVILYSIFVINLNIIVTRFFKNFSLSIVVTFIIFNFYCYIVDFISYGSNFYRAFMIRDFSLISVIIPSLIINILLTTAVIYCVYKDKEKVVLHNG